MSLRADPHGSGVGVELGIACGRALARRCASKTFRQVRVAGFGPNRQTGPRSGTGLSIRGHCQLKTFNSALQGAPGPPPRGSRPREEGTDRVKSLVSVCSAFAAGIKLADRTLRALDIEPTPIADRRRRCKPRRAAQASAGARRVLRGREGAAHRHRARQPPVCLGRGRLAHLLPARRTRSGRRARRGGAPVPGPPPCVRRRDPGGRRQHAPAAVQRSAAGHGAAGQAAHQRPGGVLRLRRREPGMARRAPGPASIAWTGEQGRRPAQGHCLDAGDAALQPAARRHPG